VLTPHGFRCFTIGRNVSLAEQTDDAVRRLMNSCECLIGVATKRLDASDRDFPERTLSIATPYLLQETAMAFQVELPFLIFKAAGITLQGVTNRNLWIEIEPELNKSERVKIHGSRERFLSALGDLKQKALARRAQMNSERLKASIGWLSALAVGGYAVSESIDVLRRPTCSGISTTRTRNANLAATATGARSRSSEGNRNNLAPRTTFPAWPLLIRDQHQSAENYPPGQPPRRPETSAAFPSPLRSRNAGSYRNPPRTCGQN
jgi:hypothetical protein